MPAEPDPCLRPVAPCPRSGPRCHDRRQRRRRPTFLAGAGLARSGQPVTGLAGRQDLHNAGLFAVRPTVAGSLRPAGPLRRIISVMYKPAQARELAAQNRKARARPPFARQPGAEPLCRFRSPLCQGRRAERSAVGWPGRRPSRPVTALACPEPERPAPPNPAPVRAGKRRARPRHARSRSPAGKPSQPRRRRLRRSVSVLRRRHPVSQPRRCAARLQAHGARLAVARHAPPRPPPAHSAARPAARAQPRLFRVAASQSPWSSAVRCLRSRASPGGAVAGWSWPAGRGGRPCLLHCRQNLGALPQTPPLSRGARGLGAKSIPQPSGQRVFAVPRQGCAPSAPGCAGP